MTSEYPQPILRWAGSKRRLIPLLLESKPDSYNRYFEPFVGSACFFLALKPQHAVLSDINPAIINLYHRVASNPSKVRRGIESIPNDPETYYLVRDRFNPTSKTLQSAVEFLYLNRHCFNGIYRTNRTGKFNVPYGSRIGKIPTSDGLLSFSKAIDSAQVCIRDFAETLIDAQKDDFAYLDPPYFKDDRTPRGEYGYGTFKPSQRQKLVSTLEDLDRREVRVLLSYKNDDYLKTTLRDQGWKIHEQAARRSIAANVEARTNSPELLISNY